MDLVYQAGSIIKTVFLKLNHSYGVSFGELNYPLQLANDKQSPPPRWKPAKEDDTFNGFYWIVRGKNDFDTAKPVPEKYINKYNLLNFAIEQYTPQQLIKYTFEGPRWII